MVLVRLATQDTSSEMEIKMYRCDGCGEEYDPNELTELEWFQGIPARSLCNKCLAHLFVRKEKRNEKDLLKV